MAKTNTPTFLIPKIVADDRTNSVIVSGEAKARDRIAKLVSRLDSELETSGNTRVYYLKYSKAEDLVKVLEGVSESIEAESNTSKAKILDATNVMLVLMLMRIPIRWLLLLSLICCVH